MAAIMDEEPPAGVDPALWAEFQLLSDEVHRLHLDRKLLDDPPRDSWRITIDLPAEQVLLFAWMAARQHKRGHGKDGPTMIGPESLDQRRLMRMLARRVVDSALNEYFHRELQQLCMGTSWLLSPEPVGTGRDNRKTDLGDDLPF